LAYTGWPSAPTPRVPNTIVGAPKSATISSTGITPSSPIEPLLSSTIRIDTPVRSANGSPSPSPSPFSCPPRSPEDCPPPPVQ
jgi:hypothetical protein